MKFEVDKELFPFENHFFKTDAGAEVHYVDEGQGVVVLMLHGQCSLDNRGGSAQHPAERLCGRAGLIDA